MVAIYSEERMDCLETSDIIVATGIEDAFLVELISFARNFGSEELRATFDFY